MKDNILIKILKHWIVKNLLLTVALILVIVFAAIIILGKYTRHNEELIVPDLFGMSVEEAEQVAAGQHMYVTVTDSMYVSNMDRGAIFKQLPEAGSAVKKGRRIALTINARQPKTVSMPNLVGFSMRQAKAELSSKGLYVGKLTYKEDIATNNVLAQKFKGRDIRPGTKVLSGSKIELVVGLNSKDGTTFVPNLTRQNTDNAVNIIYESSLNVGRVIYDETVTTMADSTKALVYRQVPAPSQYPVRMGAAVTIYLTTDTGKIESSQDSLYTELDNLIKADPELAKSLQNASDTLTVEQILQSIKDNLNSEDNPEEYASEEDDEEAFF